MTTPPDRGGNTARQPEISFPAHRGVFVPDNVHTSQSGVGVHWSASKITAESMASYAHALHPRVGVTGHHVIHHGNIPISSVEDNVATLKANGVFDQRNLNNNSEKEIPVKKGAPVFISSRTKSRESNGIWKTRERTYNPPREVKA
ncbi:hypothetical protein UFOVP965_72 [uncultured Caudovirales phage]|uniref:Uncharacterized protein n=1 Tax=uncultured Caudovirales phage TaxID=2100421 RepID=A0A6J5QFD8_9CAUD|nr:hypothetical protein UFOVP965_72 [uncultured Caudovirales phage]CAB4179825.1 hypothetical protein UFOVP1035_68 [uncultured Caudovirales phage]CAB4188489.1 hypothetical protein UFOVP1181_27 [uncultured Caudovirales phage]